MKIRVENSFHYFENVNVTKKKLYLRLVETYKVPTKNLFLMITLQV